MGKADTWGTASISRRYQLTDLKIYVPLTNTDPTGMLFNALNRL